MSQFFTSDYYLQYLEEIDAGAHSVSSWEADFLDDMLSKRPQYLSEKQEAVIRRMAKQYLHEEIG